MGENLLLEDALSVIVHDDHTAPRRLRPCGIYGPEPAGRCPYRAHRGMIGQVDNRDRPARRLRVDHTRTWDAVRQVVRAQHAWMPERFNRILAVPRVIAARNDIHAGIDEGVSLLYRHAEPIRSAVLGVGDDEVDIVPAAKL